MASGAVVLRTAQHHASACCSRTSVTGMGVTQIAW